MYTEGTNLNNCAGQVPIFEPHAPRLQACGKRNRAGAAAFGLVALLSATGAAAQLHLGEMHSLAGTFGINAQDDMWFGGSLASGDFNCDGLDDLATGAPHWNKGDIWDAGIVTIQYATADGLEGGDSEWLHQDIGGIPGAPEEYDEFGSSLASGDFNDDGCDDLAIGLVGQDVDGANGAGMVIVVYGWSTHGLDPNASQYFHQNVEGLFGTAESNDQFGSSVAAGDFDGNGVDDLAVGAPNEHTADVEGVVHVLLGTSAGLTTSGNLTFYSGAYGLPPVSPNLGGLGGFGESLAFGDIDPQRDGEELVVGTPNHDVFGAAGGGHGMVSVLFGDGNVPASFSFNQNSPGIVGNAEEWDRFGAALAIGDFDGDGYVDVAASAPNEDVETLGIVETGMVIVMSLGQSPNTSKGWLRSDIASLDEENYNNDYFGDSLASGDFDNDGIGDLAVGAPTYDSQGSQFVLYGKRDSLLSDLNAQRLDNCFSSCLPNDSWGRALASGNFDTDAGMDLATAAPRADWSAFAEAGLTSVHYSDAVFRNGFE